MKEKNKTINILGLTYTIEEVEQVDKNQRMFGEVDYVTQTIKIEKGLTKEKKVNVLIHEVLHAIFERLNFQKENENEHLIDCLTLAIYQILNDNAFDESSIKNK